MFEKTTQLLEDSRSRGDFERGILGVGTKDGLIFKHELGADEKTLFDMGSITKVMITTMIVLKLLEQGEILLSDKISQFIEVPEDKADITIQHLLTHTSGMIAHYNLAIEAKERRYVLAHILNKPLVASIGAEVNYSCIGYILLGKVLEELCGKKLNKLGEEYVFSPLGLVSTGYRPYGINIAPTEFYHKYQSHLTGIVHDENARLIGSAGNAGLFSNLEDCNRFCNMLANKGKVGDTIYLNEKLFEKAINNYTKEQSESRGLGFSLYTGEMHPLGDLFSEGSFGHTGFPGTSIFIDKEIGIYVILLTNRVFNGRVDNGFLRRRKQLHNVLISEYVRQVNESEY